MIESGEKGRILLAIAREALSEALLDQPAPEREAPWLLRDGASFVTLKLDGQLRGCIGSVRAHRPLLQDVRSNAVTAALRDQRFSPLPAEDLPAVVIEVSVLSVPERLECASEAELLEQLRPGIDGLILEFGPQRSTFLPSVWKHLPEPHSFLHQLKLKGGFAADFWSPEIAVWRYTVENWGEEPE